MTPGTSEAGRRVLLRRVYASYRHDPALGRVRREGGGTFVAGDGPMSPRLMLVGEAPGENEAKQRRPFVGASGRFLDELLASVELSRSEVFVTNVVKYRPVDKLGKNRPPTNDEVAAGIPYLRKEHRLLGMPPMVMLGKHSRKSVEWGYRLSEGLRIGEWFWMSADGGFPVLPLYHPAYGLYQHSNRPMMFRQFQAVLAPPRSPEECHAAQ